jgi:hypothetical protein
MTNIYSKDLSFYFRIMENSFIAEEAEDIDGTIKMVIANGKSVEKWYIRLSRAGCVAREAPYNDYDAQLTLTKETFIKTFLGIVPMEIAYNKGDVIIEGDVDFSAFLIICFPHPYSYDIWFYLLGDWLKMEKANEASVSFNFIINNSSNIQDDDLASLPLAASDSCSIRSVSIKDGTYIFSRCKTNNVAKSYEIGVEDKQLIKFIKGEISRTDVIHPSSNYKAAIDTALEQFCSFFSLDPLAID